MLIGDEIQYSVTVNNTGNVTLNNVVVLTTRTGSDSVVVAATLGPKGSSNASATFSIPTKYTVSENDVVNGAIACSATFNANYGNAGASVSKTASCSNNMCYKSVDLPTTKTGLTYTSQSVFLVDAADYEGLTFDNYEVVGAGDYDVTVTLKSWYK